MRAPVEHIAAPAFPAHAKWINVASLRMDQQIGRPVLIEFWDFCRPNSIRTLPYLKAWHERYAEAGLRVIGVHASGFAPSADPDNIAAAVARLGIDYPVLIDAEYELWQEYENLGWPARYLFTQDGMLFDYHYGEGAYAETERAIQELLLRAEPGPDADLLTVADASAAASLPLLSPVRPEDAPDAILAPQSEDVEGPYQGPYEAGAVWAVVSGGGTLTVNGIVTIVDHPGAYELISHPVSTEGSLTLSASEGVEILATCFTPGLAA